MIYFWREEFFLDYDLDLFDICWLDYEICGDILDMECFGVVFLFVKCVMLWEGNKKLFVKVSSVE